MMSEIPLGFPAFEGRSPSPLVRGPWAGGQTARLNCREMGPLASPWHPESPPTLPRLAASCQIVTALCAEASSRFKSLSSAVPSRCLQQPHIHTHITQHRGVRTPEKRPLPIPIPAPTPQRLDNVPRVPQSQPGAGSPGGQPCPVLSLALRPPRSISSWNSDDPFQAGAQMSTCEMVTYRACLTGALRAMLLDDAARD